MESYAQKWCGKVKNKSFPKSAEENSLSVVYGCMLEDLEPVGLARVESLLGLTVNSYTPYNSWKKKKIEKLALRKNKVVSDKVLEAIFEYYREKLGRTLDEVRYHGTWMARGHSSLIRVGVAIEVH